MEKKKKTELDNCICRPPPQLLIHSAVFQEKSEQQKRAEPKKWPHRDGGCKLAKGIQFPCVSHADCVKGPPVFCTTDYSMQTTTMDHDGLLCCGVQLRENNSTNFDKSAGCHEMEHKHETSRKILAGIPHQEKTDPPKPWDPTDKPVQLCAPKSCAGLKPPNPLRSYEQLNQLESIKENSAVFTESSGNLTSPQSQKPVTLHGKQIPLLAENEKDVQVVETQLQMRRMEEKDYLSPEEQKRLHDKPISARVLGFLKSSAPAQSTTRLTSFLQREQSKGLLDNKGLHPVDNKELYSSDNKAQDELQSLPLQEQILRQILHISYFLQENAGDFVSYYHSKEKIILDAVSSIKDSTDTEETLKYFVDTFFGTADAFKEEKNAQNDLAELDKSQGKSLSAVSMRDQRVDDCKFQSLPSKLSGLEMSNKQTVNHHQFYAYFITQSPMPSICSQDQQAKEEKQNSFVASRSLNAVGMFENLKHSIAVSVNQRGGLMSAPLANVENKETEFSQETKLGVSPASNKQDTPPQPTSRMEEHMSELSSLGAESSFRLPVENSCYSFSSSAVPMGPTDSLTSLGMGFASVITSRAELKDALRSLMRSFLATALEEKKATKRDDSAEDADKPTFEESGSSKHRFHVGGSEEQNTEMEAQQTTENTLAEKDDEHSNEKEILPDEETEIGVLENEEANKNDFETETERGQEYSPSADYLEENCNEKLEFPEEEVLEKSEFELPEKDASEAMEKCDRLKACQEPELPRELTESQSTSSNVSALETFDQQHEKPSLTVNETCEGLEEGEKQEKEERLEADEEEDTKKEEKDPESSQQKSEIHTKSFLVAEKRNVECPTTAVPPLQQTAKSLLHPESEQGSFQSLSQLEVETPPPSELAPAKVQASVDQNRTVQITTRRSLNREKPCKAESTSEKESGIEHLQKGKRKKLNSSGNKKQTKHHKKVGKESENKDSMSRKHLPEFAGITDGFQFDTNFEKTAEQLEDKTMINQDRSLDENNSNNMQAWNFQRRRKIQIKELSSQNMRTNQAAEVLENSKGGNLMMKPGGYFPEYPKRNVLPVIGEKIDVRHAVFKVMTASTSGAGGGSAGQGMNTSGGGSSGGWGGARPKTYGTNRGGDNGGGTGGDDPEDNRRPLSSAPPTSLPAEFNPGEQGAAPARDYKRYRKKQHGAITNEQLCHCLGKAGGGIQAIHDAPEIAGWLEDFDQCLWLCLHHTQSITAPSSDDLACCTCAVLHSLLCHFTSSGHGISCSLCQQLFTLVNFHVEQCMTKCVEEKEVDESEANVCLRMRRAGLFAGGTTSSFPPKVWLKVQKYLSAALGPVLFLSMMEREELQQTLPASAQQARRSVSEGILAASAVSEAVVEGGPDKQNVGDAGLPQLSSMTQQQQQPGHQDSTTQHAPPQTAPAQPGPTPQAAPAQQQQPAHATKAKKDKLARKPSVKVVPQTTIPEEPSSMPPSHLDLPEPTSDDVFAANLIQTPISASAAGGDGQEEEEDVMKYIKQYTERLNEEGSGWERQRRPLEDDPYSTQPTYGPHGTVSMPEPRVPDFLGNQNFSVEIRPTGVKGIGEVVYGTIQQLKLVANQWSRERDRCKQTGYCEYQIREEGVILHQFKKQLVILRTRYQKHQQWERLVHLGNGVQGKCHLCIDRSSNFKFCCKRVHILRYDEHELDIWSELQHTNVVRFYGALRHGEKIYLFAEFIDGGSLSAMINEQRSVGRRLSHWTSLNYFRQILHVLIYLQQKGILHEDIKGDNLLLREGSTEIVLADFGTAQKIPHDHVPPNRAPTGSPAHWAPEKASSEGHGFPSDLWAAACVLIHMLSGSPPWIRRFANAQILHFLIWNKPPPMEDVPDDVKESVRDLIECCLVKDKNIRPSASNILSHRAFQLLDQSGSLFSTFNQPAVLGALGGAGASAEHGGRSPRPSLGGGEALGDSHSEGTALSSAVTSVNSSQGTRSGAQEGSLQLSDSQFTLYQTGHAGNNNGAQSLPASFHAGPKKTHAAVGRRTSDPIRHPTQETSPAAANGSQLVLSSEGRQQVPNSGDGVVITAVTTASSPHLALTGAERSSQMFFATAVTAHQQEGQHQEQQQTRQQEPTQLLQRQIEVEAKQGRSDVTKPDPLQASSNNVTKVSVSRPTDIALADSLHPTLWPEVPSPVLTLSLTAASQAEAIIQGAGIYTSVSNPGMMQSNSIRSQGTQLTSTLMSGSVPAWRSGIAIPDLNDAHPELGNLQPPYSVASSASNLHLPGPRMSADSLGSSLGQGDSGGDGLYSYGTTSSGPTKGLESHQTRHVSTASSGLTLSQPTNLSTRPDTATTSATNTNASASDSEYPPLSEEDIQVVGGSRFLSVIPEAVGQESLSPTTRLASSDDDSGDEAIYRYIQDQLGEEQSLSLCSLQQQPLHQSALLQPSLQQQLSGSPSLQPYSTAPGLAASSVPGMNSTATSQPTVSFLGIPGLPNFMLLSIYSESSTLRSGRIHSGEPSSLQPASRLENQTPGAPAAGSFQSAEASALASDTLDNAASSGLERRDLKSAHYVKHTAGFRVSGLQGGRVDATESSGHFAFPGPGHGHGHILSPGNSDEDRISSGDMFGSGPSGSRKDFLEASQYRERQVRSGLDLSGREQQQQLLQLQQLELQQQQLQQQLQQQELQQQLQQQQLQQQLQQPGAWPFSQTGPPPLTTRAMSPGLNRRHPNLKLKMTGNGSSPNPVYKADQSTSNYPAVGVEDGKQSAVPQSASAGTRSKSSTALDDGAFFMNTGVSPLTSSPYTLESRLNDGSRSRNESGSSLSTPKSSTFDKQEHEWEAFQEEFQQVAPEFMLTSDEYQLTSSSTSASETTNPHLRYYPLPDDLDQEESMALSLLQDEIPNNNIGGMRLVFVNEEGIKLFDMRVRSRSRAWKELAQTFRGKIRAAGYLHYILYHQDGTTPVECFSACDPSITQVKVMRVADDDHNILTVCWCENHLIF